jgi:hypothetical protein
MTGVATIWLDEGPEGVVSVMVVGQAVIASALEQMIARNPPNLIE